MTARNWTEAELDARVRAEVASWPRIEGERAVELRRLLGPAMDALRARLAAEAEKAGATSLTPHTERQTP